MLLVQKRLLSLCSIVALLCSACDDTEQQANFSQSPDAGDGADANTSSDSGNEDSGDSSTVDAGPVWVPGEMLGSLHDDSSRGWLNLRGLIHAHSVYSHDACDNKPRDPETDQIDSACLNDFREGICTVGHDFVGLTDHNESFGRSEFPDTLLYLESANDTLVKRNDKPVANWLPCDSGHKVLIMAGTESATMPIGLEGHIEGTVDERQAIYGETSEAAINTFKAQGAVALVAHTEDWTVEQLTTLPLDGFEMYNLHANLMTNIPAAGDVLVKITHPEQLPHSDLILLPIFKEDPIYLSSWGSVLASGVKRVTTMGTDCHRNSIPIKLPDGERGDSYRRMMWWFSNHLLVKANSDGSWDDTAIKSALRSGRLYGVFEMLGYPIGFDYYAKVGATIYELGEEAPLNDKATVVVKRPSMRNPNLSGEQPIIQTRLLKAVEGGWTEISSGEKDLEVVIDKPGAYRAEIRITPKHLREYLGVYTELADKDFPWIYSNAIYVK